MRGRESSGRTTQLLLTLLLLERARNGARLGTWVNTQAPRPTTKHAYLLFCFVNFVPSRERLYISPFWPKTKATIESFRLFVSIVPPAPKVTRETEPSTPAFQPSLSRNRFRAPSSKNTR